MKILIILHNMYEKLDLISVLSIIVLFLFHTFNALWKIHDALAQFYYELSS